MDDYKGLACIMWRFSWHLRQPSPNACSGRAFHSATPPVSACCCCFLTVCHLFYFLISCRLSAHPIQNSLEHSQIRHIRCYVNFKRAEYAAYIVEAAASCRRKGFRRMSRWCPKRPVLETWGQGGMLAEGRGGDVMISWCNTWPPAASATFILLLDQYKRAGRKDWWADMGLW